MGATGVRSKVYINIKKYRKLIDNYRVVVYIKGENYMKVKSMKVVRVTKTEFELEDGRVYDHPVELEDIPSLEDFQEVYDEWVKKFQEMFGSDDGKVDNCN